VLSARAGVRPDRLYGEPAAFHDPVGHGPLFGRTRLIVTIHDLTAFTHPEWHARRTGFLIQNSMPYAARHADRVLCDSEYVRRQVIATFGVDPARAVTVPLAVGAGFGPLPDGEAVAHVRRRFGIEPPFILTVGTFEPRKNHVGLLAAYERLCAEGFPGPLVVAGGDGWRMAEIRHRFETSPQAARVVRIRDADDRDLAALYGACTVFAFPSWDEGFGLPPLEAMACGAACVASDRASLPEVVGDAGVLFDPADRDALTDTLIALWRDEERRRVLGAAGIVRARAFDRQTFADRMLAIYREVLALGPRGSGSGARAQ
jgi:alpha-1,3-rhamnosyl/mannosyltransferase